MKRGLVLIAVLSLWSLPLAAGEFLMNDSGETATALRVMFSEPVVITSFGETLMDVSPSGESDVLIFTGGEVEAWGGQWLNWQPTSAELVSAEWLASGWDLPEDATAEDFDYEVTLDNISATVRISRHIDRKCLPFLVRYEVVNPETLAGYELSWDTDKYVDNDGNGNPQDDRDYDGPSLELTYIENYNPTVTLLVLDGSGTILAQWENLARNDFPTTATIELDGANLLHVMGVDIADGEVCWAQLHMPQMGFEYMTEHESLLQNADMLTASAQHAQPGRYVYEFTAVSQTGESFSARVSAWVVDETIPKKPAGLMMQDIWNECYDSIQDTMVDCSLFFTDQQAHKKLDWLTTQGVHELIIKNQVPIVATTPTPVLTTVGEVGFINCNDLAALSSHVGSMHLSMQAWCFMDPADEDYNRWWLYVGQLSRDYLEAFFSQYREIILAEAACAQDTGASSYVFASNHPYLKWVLPELADRSPEDAAWFCDRWISLCRAVKEIFDGPVGIGAPALIPLAQDIVNEVDFVVLHSIRFDEYRDGLAAADDFAQLTSGYRAFAEAEIHPIFDFFSKPVRVTFFPYSIEDVTSIGWWDDREQDTYATWRQEFSWEDHSAEILRGETNPDYPPDFCEQVRMIEALMNSLARAPYVESVFAGFEFWKLVEYMPFTPPGILDYHSLFSGSLQGKPAFDAIRLWLSMLQPSEQLAYRKRIPFDVSDSPAADTAFGPLEPVVDWENAQERFIYSGTGKHPPSSESSSEAEVDPRTVLPGHDIGSIGVDLNDDVLGILWNSNASDFLTSAYRHTIIFFEPASNAAAFVVSAVPHSNAVELQFRVGDTWFGTKDLSHSLVQYSIRSDRIEIYLPRAFPLPSIGTVGDLSSWIIEAYLVLPESQGDFYIQLVESARFDQNGQ